MSSELHRRSRFFLFFTQLRRSKFFLEINAISLSNGRRVPYTGSPYYLVTVNGWKLPKIAGNGRASLAVRPRERIGRKGGRDSTITRFPKASPVHELSCRRDNVGTRAPWHSRDFFRSDARSSRGLESPRRKYLEETPFFPIRSPTRRDFNYENLPTGRSFLWFNFVIIFISNKK